MKFTGAATKNILSLMKFLIAAFFSFVVLHFLFDERFGFDRKIIVSIILGLVIFYYTRNIHIFEKRKRVSKPAYMYYNSPSDKDFKRREKIIDKLLKEKGVD